MILLKKTFKKIIESQNITIPESFINDIITLSSHNNKTKEQETDEEKKIDTDKQKKNIKDTYSNNIVVELLSNQFKLPTFDQKLDEKILNMLNMYNPDGNITKDSPEFQDLRETFLKDEQGHSFKNVVYREIENDLGQYLKEVFKEENQITLKEARILLQELK